MPKEKQSVSSGHKNIVREFDENMFATVQMHCCVSFVKLKLIMKINIISYNI